MPDPTPATTGETPANAVNSGGMVAGSSTTTTAPAGTVIVTGTPGTPPPPPPPDTPTAAGSEEPFDRDRAMALISKLRDEVKDAKAEAATGAQAAQRLAEIEREQMTELERTKAEKADADQALAVLQQQRRDDALRLAVYAQRDTLSIASPDLAIAALDRSRVEYDDVGQPTNLIALLEDLLEREPVLKGTAPRPTIPPTDGGRRDNATPDLTADELDAARTTGMTPERYAAVKKAMAGRKAVSVAELIAAGLGKQG